MSPHRSRLASAKPQLAGQTVVVIGGNWSVALDTARRAHDEGAKVVLTARDADGLSRVCLELEARIAAFDATDFDRLGSFLRELPAPIDHVLLMGLGPLDVPLQVARNAAGKVRPGGTLLFMGRTGGRHAARGVALIPAAGAALPAVTKNLALKLAPIRVNLIVAGFVDAPPSAALPRDRLRKRREPLRTMSPIRGVVDAADVAALAVQLMTNPAITGATFQLDRGQRLVVSSRSDRSPIPSHGGDR